MGQLASKKPKCVVQCAYASLQRSHEHSAYYGSLLSQPNRCRRLPLPPAAAIATAAPPPPSTANFPPPCPAASPPPPRALPHRRLEINEVDRAVLTLKSQVRKLEQQRNRVR